MILKCTFLYWFSLVYRLIFATSSYHSNGKQSKIVMVGEFIGMFVLFLFRVSFITFSFQQHQSFMHWKEMQFVSWEEQKKLSSNYHWIPSLFPWYYPSQIVFSNWFKPFHICFYCSVWVYLSSTKLMHGSYICSSLSIVANQLSFSPILLLARETKLHPNISLYWSGILSTFLYASFHPKLIPGNLSWQTVYATWFLVIIWSHSIIYSASHPHTSHA